MQQRIRELEAQIAQNSTSQATPSIPNESIDRPKNASKITMQAIRAKLGYDKTRWNSFRSYCRDAATSARLNWDGNWKSQRSEKLSMAYNAVRLLYTIPRVHYSFPKIEAAFPETRRFEGQWAIDRTVKQCWDNRKNYRNCVNKPTTFRGKEAAARRARRVQSPASTSRTSPASPTPGPSRRRPSTHRNSDSGSDDDDDDDGDRDNEDEFVAASDNEPPRDEQDEDELEEEDDGGMSEKAKGKRKASEQGGKDPKQARRG
ncbi:hypothetical protein K438DRAFT_1218661 [Mycena galopus ATCC 62051]|nr:hypothetical protein K438DRAFT_1013211 [Mycena galopus ATCC 62051]KAF8211911.1 hypothetical protein K438DRAFT_1218661 [Mycena galopus ATCC 62051]